MRGSNFIDLTGKRFGRLIVVKRADDYVYNNKNGRRRIKVRWLCKCDCGGEKTVIGESLKNGYTKSCGCFELETKRKNGKLFKRYNTYDLSGEYGVGYTSKGELFYFDLEDYDKIKDYCWRIDEFGYVLNKLDGEYTRMHRLVMNCPDDIEVDHVDHITRNNRKENLRIATRSQNCMNRGLASNNTSSVTGVYWHTRDEKWFARININEQQIHLGYFDNFEDAVQARKDAELKYYGDFRKKLKTT